MCPFEGRDELAAVHCEALYAMYVFGYGVAQDVAQGMEAEHQSHMLMQWNGDETCAWCDQAMEEMLGSMGDEIV